MKRFRDTEYIVSSDGRIFRDGRELNPQMMGNGYLKIGLSNDGVISQHLIHRMVAELYLDNPEGKTQVNHINGKKKVNDVTNLEWVTPKENIQHAYDTGLQNDRGENSVNAKLTNEQAEMIRALYVPKSSKLGMKALAEKFGVGIQTINRIIKNVTYKNEFSQS